MKDFCKSVGRFLLIFCFVETKAQRSFSIGVDYKMITTNLPDDSPAKSISLFASQVSTDAMTIAAEAPDAGKLTIKLSFLKMIYAKPEKRGSAIFANGLLLTPN